MKVFLIHSIKIAFIFNLLFSEKIRSRQEQDKHTKSTSKSLSAIEEFCEKFDRSVRNSVIKVCRNKLIKKI